MTDPQSVNRRDFVRGLGLGALAMPTVVRAVTDIAVSADPVFTHGLASGDPLADRVIIWTRIAPQTRPQTVLWDVARDPGFQQMLRRGRALASAAADWTVKVDVPGLPADTLLYYRFTTLGRMSRSGRTRTLPVGSTAQVKLALFSCSNYPAGFFHVYAEAARTEGLHAAVHVGDYIYEYAPGGYASESAAQLGRVVTPANELISLADYRTRYAQYRSDPDLQSLHESVPFICVWDDHESANDAWRDGAQNHNPGEGLWANRKAAAVQAYHEWMPIRSPDPARLDVVYRSFTFGNLVDLHMLDTRLVGRDKQLSFTDYLGAGGFNAAAFTNDLASPTRQLLGSQQSAWLAGRMAATSATWTVLGQQVLFGRMNIPAPLVLQQVTFSAYSALLLKAATAPATLTSQEKAILAQPAIPYNLDAWDGHAAARETVLGTARTLKKNLVVLSGDTHNAWANDLTDIVGNAVGVEFGGPSVSSPGFEAVFPNENPVAVAAGLAQIIGPLVWCETEHRGFVIVTATASECRADWRFVSTVKDATYNAFTGRSLRTLPGAGARKLVDV